MIFYFIIVVIIHVFMICPCLCYDYQLSQLSVSDQTITKLQIDICDKKDKRCDI